MVNREDLTDPVEETVQYGKQFPDGEIQWAEPHDPLGKRLTTEKGRAEEQDGYRFVLTSNHIVPTKENRLRFLTRRKFINYSDATQIVEGE